MHISFLHVQTNRHGGEKNEQKPKQSKQSKQPQ